jgi:hypothetical protein
MSKRRANGCSGIPIMKNWRTALFGCLLALASLECQWPTYPKFDYTQQGQSIELPELSAEENQKRADELVEKMLRDRRAKANPSQRD